MQYINTIDNSPWNRIPSQDTVDKQQKVLLNYWAAISQVLMCYSSESKR